ncbi:MAG: universal stress protein [Bacteroidota bacterium]
MSNIIVPIDFSANSIFGLRLAIVYANKMKTDVKMIHVLKELTTPQVKQKFEEIIEKHKKALKKGKLLYKISKGKIHQEVTNQAKYDESLMIVTSTHGASGFADIFIGSNAYKIVSSAECPVIIFRKGVCPKDIKKIVVPIDKTETSRQKVPFAAEQAKFFNAEIQLIGITDESRKEAEQEIKPYLKQVETFLKERKVKFKTEFIKGQNNAETVLNYAKEAKAELIVVMTEQETTLSNILLGPYAQQMANHADIPVMFIHPKDNYSRDLFRAFGV